jgi:hypothetical protein
LWHHSWQHWLITVHRKNIFQNCSLYSLTATSCYCLYLFTSKAKILKLNNNNNNSRFDMRSISSGMRIQSTVKCHCYLTQKQHTTVMQPKGAVLLSQHNTETQGTMTSHYFGQKGKIVNLF